jgi:ankyrin repeat protein
LDEIPWSFLHYSTFHNFKSSVKVLLLNGCDQNKRDKSGVSSYDIAKILENDEILKLFKDFKS